MVETAAIILAAGGSKRLGRPKQLLDWFGVPFIRKVIDTAIEANLYPIVVVTGAYFEEVESVITGKDVIITKNEAWQTGQSSSLISGIRALNDFSFDSFVFMLCDQPQVPAELIKKMIMTAHDSKIKIVSSSVNQKSCPPILFKRECTTELLKLKGDQGGKSLINRYETRLIEWEDKRIILDVDTEKDYKKLIESFSI